MEKLIVIDGHSLAYRAFYALPLLSNKNGDYTNAVYGFCNILLKAISNEKPTHVAVAFDSSKPTFRHEKFAEYKGTRKKMPDELVAQMPILRSLLQSMKIATYSFDGIEADDIIGTICKQTSIETIIITGDKDSLQLIDDTTSVLLTKKGISETKKMTLETLKEEMGLEPSQIVDLKALMGDASDNIPGVSGVGEKTAMQLISQYQNLEGVYQNIAQITGKLKEKLENSKEIAFLSHELATIETNCNFEFDLNDCSFSLPLPAEAKQQFELFEFKTLLNKSDLFASAPSIAEPTHKKAKVVQISSMQELLRAVEECKAANTFAFDFEKQISFANEHKAYVTTNEISMFSSGLDTLEVMHALREVFLQTKEFICYGSKWHMHQFKKWGIEFPTKVFDLKLALHLTKGGYTPENMHIEDMIAQKHIAQQELKEFGLEQLFFEIEQPLISVLFDMESKGCKVDISVLENLSEQFQTTLASLTKEIYELAEQEFNISSPKQVSEVLFDKLHISTQFNKKRSTAMDVLTEVQHAHPIVPLIIRYRKFFKLKTSFLDSLISLCQKNNNFIHTTYHQTLTTTGRLSSSDPNLQNIPTRDEEGKAIRSAFVSRFENGSITTADYNQIELRILAALSHDEHMIDAFVNNFDIHRATAAKIFNITPEEVSSQQRRDAKSVNFGVVYGISDYGLSQNIGCSVKEAKMFIDRYFEVYPSIKTYLNSAILGAKEKGFSLTILNRRRNIPELRSSNRNLQQFGERVAMNAPIQGSAADVMKAAMIRVHQSLQQNNLKSLLILQIHDELIIDTYPGEEEQVRGLLKENMEDVIKLSVHLSADVGNGNSWLEAK